MLITQLKLLKGAKRLDEFDSYVDFFRHTDTHDSAHDTLFRVDVDEALVDPHFPTVPCCGTFTAWTFKDWNT
jgi:hypothetical protein